MTPADDHTLTCPQCGALRAGLYAPCTYCGAKFIKKKIAEAAPAVRKPETATRPVRVPRLATDEVVNGTIGKQELTVLGTGAAAALIVLILPVIGSLARGLVTVLHDAGHCLGGWLAGHPSFPVVGFSYPGAGAIRSGGFWWPLALAVAAGIAYAAYHFRHNTKVLTMIGIAGGLWLLVVTADWRRDVFFASSGHLTEIVLAAVMLQRGLSRRGKMSDLIAKLEAFAGFVIVLNLVAFAFRIATNRMAREWYRVGSGTGRSDLFVIAQNLDAHLVGIGVPVLALLLLLAALVVPLGVAIFVHRNRATLRRMIASSFAPATA